LHIREDNLKGILCTHNSVYYRSCEDACFRFSLKPHNRSVEFQADRQASYPRGVMYQVTDTQLCLCLQM